MNVQEIIQEHGIGEKIGEGKCGSVYRIGNSNLAVKFRDGIRATRRDKNKIENANALEREMDVTNQAHARELSVPIPYGVFGVMHPEKGSIQPGYIMEYASGRTLGCLSGREYSLGCYLRDSELKKALDAGFITFDDDCDDNVVISDDFNRATLIDLEQWSKG